MSRKKYVLKICTDKSKLEIRTDETDLTHDMSAESVISELKTTLRDYPELVVLAAPQLNQSKRIFCMKFADGDIRAFVNPMILKSKGIHLSREKSLSIPDKEFIIPRNDEIEVAYQTPLGTAESNLFKGPAAEMFQQMVNLLDGILLDDVGLEIIEGFDEADQETKDKIIDLYLESLKVQDKNIKIEIDSNPELKEIDKAIDFYTSVALGKTKLEDFTIKKEVKKRVRKTKIVKA